MLDLPMRDIKGEFCRSDMAERAINELLARGFPEELITVTARDDAMHERVVAVQRGLKLTSARDAWLPRLPALGVLMGVGLGLLIWLSILIHPGFAAVRGAVAALLLLLAYGAGAGAAFAGLLDMARPMPNSVRYAIGATCDDVALTLHVPADQASEAESVLQQALAVSIDHPALLSDGDRR